MLPWERLPGSRSYFFTPRRVRSSGAMSGEAVDLPPGGCCARLRSVVKKRRGLTASDEFGRNEAREVGLLAVPKYPELLGCLEGERRGRRRGRYRVEVEEVGCGSGVTLGVRLGGGDASPDAEDVAGEATREARQHRVLEEGSAKATRDLAPHQLPPFYPAEIRL
jgi:hypothetical protein